MIEKQQHLSHVRPAKIVERLRETGMSESEIEKAFSGHIKGPWRRLGSNTERRDGQE